MKARSDLMAEVGALEAAAQSYAGRHEFIDKLIYRMTFADEVPIQYASILSPFVPRPSLQCRSSFDLINDINP